MIHKEHVFRDRHRTGLVIPTLGRVEKFQAFALPNRRGIPLDRRLKESVQDPRRDGVLSHFDDLFNGIKNLCDVLLMLCRNRDLRSIGNKEKIVSELLTELIDSVLEVGIRMIEIELIEKEEAGLVFIENHLGDAAVLGDYS